MDPLRSTPEVGCSGYCILVVSVTLLSMSGTILLLVE